MRDKLKKIINVIQGSYSETNMNDQYDQYVSQDDMKYLLEKLKGSKKDNDSLKNFCYKL